MNKFLRDIKVLVEDNLTNTTEITKVANASRNHIIREQAELNDYISIISEEALEVAVAEAISAPSQRLLGIPVSIKDNISVREFPLTCASKMLADFDKPLYTATVVERLRAAGSIVMGKVNLDEFAMGSNGETSYYGPTKNPFDVTCVPGGSSSGSAVSVASGGVKISLGTDTGGSVRQPASFNNLVGLKPTYGRVSRFGVTAFASSLDQVGIMTKTVADNALALEVIAGVDPMDTTSSRLPVPAYSEQLETSLKGKKIAIIKEYFSEEINAEIKETMYAALEVYKKLGAEVTEVSIPALAYVVPTYYIIASAEASSNLARFDGLHFGHRAEGFTDADDIMCHSRAEGLGKEVKKRLLLGTYYLSNESYDEHYLKAAKMRQVILNDFTKIFAEHDVIVGPTTPVSPKKIGQPAETKNADYLNDLCTIPANLTGLPALSVPAGFTENNLPIGMQITGRAFDELQLYQFAYAFEQATKYYEQTAPCVESFAEGKEV